MKGFDFKEQINYWKLTSNKDWKTAIILFENRRYDSCLFFCHLALEKILKGLVVARTKKVAPYSHDLAKLAKMSKINVSKECIDNLRIINSFNISSRYDSVKLEFYRRCTKEYTSNYLNIAKKIYLWLKKQFPKK